MIPVLIVPILNRPELLVDMTQSIDVFVRTVIVVDNGDVVRDLPVHRTPDLRLIRTGHNLGVAASWNLGIKSTPLAPWWFIANFDVVFAPGDLERMADTMDAANGPLVAQMAGVGFSGFGVNSACLERVGMFDENLHPAYFEDNDFAYRCVMGKVPIVTVPSKTTHVGSATIFGDTSYRKQNHRTFEDNRDYYVAKWGGMPGKEVHTTPFGLRLSEPGITFGRIKSLAWERS